MRACPGRVWAAGHAGLTRARAAPVSSQPSQRVPLLCLVLERCDPEWLPRPAPSACAGISLQLRGRYRAGTDGGVTAHNPRGPRCTVRSPRLPRRGRGSARSSIWIKAAFEGRRNAKEAVQTDVPTSHRNRKHSGGGVWTCALVSIRGTRILANLRRAQQVTAE